VIRGDVLRTDFEPYILERGDATAAFVHCGSEDLRRQTYHVVGSVAVDRNVEPLADADEIDESVAGSFLDPHHGRQLPAAVERQPFLGIRQIDEVVTLT
jgi:hypothetical protein